MSAHPLSALFNPRSIAIVGASERSTWTIVMRQCSQDYGFTGPTFAVNRSGSSVFGWPGYTSCVGIAERVDAAYICVPLEGVMDALEDVANAGIKAAVVLTSGYSETGAEGAARQHALAARAEEFGIHLLGPNCLGFANVATNTAITAIPKRGALLPGGGISFVCQSGATAAELLEFAQQRGISVSFFAATGNEAQIALADVVDYLIDDANTRAIMLVAESIRHTKRFTAAAGRALLAGKPLVALKVGSSELAASVAKAHTGAMVGDDRVFSAACQQLGIIRVASLEELVITTALLAHTGPLRPGGVGVTSTSGGACTIISDQAQAAGMPLRAFAPDTAQRLRTVLPDYATIYNPLDVTGAFVREPIILEQTLAIIGMDPAIALRYCVINLPWVAGTTTPTPEMLAAVGRGLRTGSSPALLVTQTIKPVSDVSRELMREHGIPAVIGGLDHATRAAGSAVWWSAKQRRAAIVIGAATPTNPLPKAPAHALAPDTAATERECLDYLASFGVPVIPATLARSAAEAVAHARMLGGRVALKIASPDIAHKTEVGGVQLRLEGDDAVAAAWQRIDASARAAAPQARIEGVVVSPMRERGIELFVGTARDPDWGAVIVLGLGGIWVEALQDTALRLLPVDQSDVIEMLHSLRAIKLLQGYRGSQPADLEAIADVIVRVGQAALALGPKLAAFEINPLLVDGSSVEALDALITWR